MSEKHMFTLLMRMLAKLSISTEASYFVSAMSIELMITFAFDSVINAAE